MQKHMHPHTPRHERTGPAVNTPHPIGATPPAPLHNLLVCDNPSDYGHAWWLCPPRCPHREWGRRHSPHRPPAAEAPPGLARAITAAEAELAACGPTQLGGGETEPGGCAHAHADTRAHHGGEGSR